MFCYNKQGNVWFFALPFVRETCQFSTDGLADLLGRATNWELPMPELMAVFPE